MRKKIFRSLVFGIFGSALLVFAVTRAFSSESSDERFQRSLRWVGSELAPHWDSPESAVIFAEEASQELGADVALRDANGHVIHAVGKGCRSPMVLMVSKKAQAIGQMDVCFHHPSGFGWRIVLSLLICFSILWWASGKAARRMARPLDELASVVQKIGSGDLSARASCNFKRDSEVALVGRAVNEMAGRLQKQLDDQKELLAAVSHEFRTPLTRLRLISEIARSKAPESFAEVDREVDDMDSLVGQLLAQSRLEFGQVHLQPISPFELCTRALTRASLPLTLLIGTADEAIVGDATLLLRAVANLLDNATRHGKGVAALIIEKSGAMIRIVVEDVAGEIPFEGLALFDQKPGGRGEGLGLGLNLVRKIVQAHRGQLLAFKGPGSRVGFEIPIAR
jgi:two-component system, OmpR family, sensor kinase